MRIPPTPVHRAPITGPGAWRRADFSSPEDWTYRLSPAALEELERAVKRMGNQQKSIAVLTAEDFPVSSLAGDVARLREELRAGRGFLVIRRLPVERYTQEQACRMYLALSSLFGAPLPQNVKGDLLYSVRDEGYDLSRDYGAVGVRFSKTTSELFFHTDSAPLFQGRTPDVVALLALQTAKSGGAAALISAQTIHNILLQEEPQRLERLYAGYHFDRRAELGDGESPTLFAPVFTYHSSLAMRHFPFYIYKAQELTGEALSGADKDSLESLDRITRREQLPVTFQMEPGDVQFVNNAFILHSRTAFEDHPEPERRRHLVRLWLAFSPT